MGTTTPIAPLHVYNSAGVSLSNTSTVNYTQSATLGFNYGGGSVGTRDSFRIVSNTVNRDNGAGPFYDYGAQADLVFQRKTNNLYSSGANNTTYTEVMRLGGATGNVGIGTTTPNNKLDVAGGIQMTTNASQPLVFLNSIGPYNWNVGGQNDGTFRVFAGTFNGVQVGWAGTSWSAISDRRLKEDIEPLDNCLSKIVSLNPVSYRMINRPSTLTKKQFGLIAQEVLDIIPDIVESSWNDTAQEDRYSLLYTEIVPFLIGAIKEQNDVITSQAATNSAMQTQLSALIAWAQTQGYPASS